MARPAVKLLLLDEEDRVLLIQVRRWFHGPPLRRP
jgi:hypothetical protein